MQKLNSSVVEHTTAEGGQLWCFSRLVYFDEGFTVVMPLHNDDLCYHVALCNFFMTQINFKVAHLIMPFMVISASSAIL